MDSEEPSTMNMTFGQDSSLELLHKITEVSVIN
jgi:hypothetical protein